MWLPRNRRRGGLVVELPLTGDGNSLEHVLMLPTQSDNRPEPTGIISLALFDPPAAGYRLGTPSSGYLIAIEGDRGLLPPYCEALNMREALCDRLSGISFVEDVSDKLLLGPPVMCRRRLRCLAMIARWPRRLVSPSTDTAV